MLIKRTNTVMVIEFFNLPFCLQHHFPITLSLEMSSGVFSNKSQLHTFFLHNIIFTRIYKQLSQIPFLTSHVYSKIQSYFIVKKNFFF